MHEIPIDASPEHVESRKRLDKLFESVTARQFEDFESTVMGRAKEAREHKQEKSRTQSVLTTQGRVTVGRNQQCPCGNQKKYKSCCGIGA